MPPVNPPLLAGFDLNQTNTTAPSAGQISDGYTTNEIPLSDNHGFMFNQWYSWLNYLKSVGTAQWDVSVSYDQHSRTMRNGVIYRSNIDANVGNDPLTDTVNWKAQPSDAHLIDFTNPHQVTAAQIGAYTTTQVDSTFAPLASPALTGVPTAPTAAVGTNTTQLATTAFAYGTAVKSNNGYIILPNDIIIQWGQGSTSAAGSAINFPIAFPNSIYGAPVVSPSSVSQPANTYVAVSGFNLTLFNVSSNGGTPTVDWFAVGR